MPREYKAVLDQNEEERKLSLEKNQRKSEARRFQKQTIKPTISKVPFGKAATCAG